MAKNLELNVRGDSKSATAALAAAAREMDQAARQADQLGRAFDAAKRDAAQLDRELLKNAATVKLLAKQYATADVEIRGGLKKQLDAHRAAGAELQRVRRDLLGGSEKDAKRAEQDFKKAVAGFEKIASGAGSDGAGSLARSLSKGLADAISAGGPEVKVALANVIAGGVLAAGAPIGAALDGVLLAGVGLGGIGLGIAGQLHNPAVVAAAQQLGQDLKANLTAATSGFAEPLAKSLHTIDQSLSGTLKGLADDLDALAPHTEKLAQGVGKFFEEAFGGPGFEHALREAGPILDNISDHLDDLGVAFDRFFDRVADGSKGAEDGMSAIFLAAETLIVGIGGIVDGLSHLYEWFLAPGKKVLSWWDELRGNTHGTAHELGVEIPAAAGTGFGSIVSGADTAAQHLSDLDRQFDGIVNDLLGLDSANVRIAQDFADLGKNLHGVGDKLDINTQKGRDNREVLDGLVGDLERQREAAIKAGGGTKEAFDKANASFNDQLNKAEALAVKLGVDKKAAHDYFAQFHDISFTITETHITQFKTSGQRLTGSSRFGGRDEFALGGIRRAAAGMLIPPSSPGTTLVGEPQTGGEALIPLRGISRQRAMSLAGVVGDAYKFNVTPRLTSPGPNIAAMWGGGGGAVNVNLTLTVAGNNTGAASWIHSMIRTGDLQLVARDRSGNSLPVKVV